MLKASLTLVRAKNSLALTSDEYDLIHKQRNSIASCILSNYIESKSFLVQVIQWGFTSFADFLECMSYFFPIQDEAEWDFYWERQSTRLPRKFARDYRHLTKMFLFQSFTKSDKCLLDLYQGADLYYRDFLHYCFGYRIHSMNDLHLKKLIDRDEWTFIEITDEGSVVRGPESVIVNFDGVFSLLEYSYYRTIYRQEYKAANTMIYFMYQCCLHRSIRNDPYSFLAGKMMMELMLEDLETFFTQTEVVGGTDPGLLTRFKSLKHLTPLENKFLEEWTIRLSKPEEEIQEALSFKRQKPNVETACKLTNQYSFSWNLLDMNRGFPLELGSIERLEMVDDFSCWIGTSVQNNYKVSLHPGYYRNELFFRNLNKQSTYISNFKLYMDPNHKMGVVFDAFYAKFSEFEPTSISAMLLVLMGLDQLLCWIPVSIIQTEDLVVKKIHTSFQLVYIPPPELVNLMSLTTIRIEPTAEEKDAMLVRMLTIMSPTSRAFFPDQITFAEVRERYKEISSTKKKEKQGK